MHKIVQCLQYGWRFIFPDITTSLSNSVKTMSLLQTLKFDNKVLATLPVDESEGNESRTVSGACFSLVKPTPVDKPTLVIHSKHALQLLDLSKKDIADDKFVEYFSGNTLLPGSIPAAHCYCGHQFGYFSGQLGDGAAIYLGEVINQKGERWELQLKGAGQTPFSRRNDGRKVLRSSIREFLCSEAMHHLGIATTRAGTCITSDSRVVRDIFYDGHPQRERCTIVSRIAPTFIRFGSFEIFKPVDRETGREGPSVGRTDILLFMLEYVVSTFYPEIYKEHEENKEECYFEFYKEVVRRTAKLVAQWQCIGFCHGVLNTDNMSILGITIDYGPYGFMDYFDPDFICNASDNQGRYSYKKQPEMCKWNLLKLAEAIKDAVPLDKTKKVLNEIYDVEFQLHYYGTMRLKLGLSHQDGDEDLIQSLLHTMQKTSADFTNTFRLLSDVLQTSDTTLSDADIVERFVNQCENIEGVKKKYKSKINITQVKTLLRVAESNPQLLLQLGMSVEELEAMVEKDEKEKEITNLTSDEKVEGDRKHWNEWINTYRKRIDMEMKESNLTSEEFASKRKQSMDSVNPRIVLRNYMAQEVIDAAEQGNYTKLQDLLSLLENPFTDNSSSELSEENTDKTSVCRYTSTAPSWGTDLRVT